MATFDASFTGTVCTPEGKTQFLVQGENEILDEEMISYLKTHPMVMEVTGQSEIDLQALAVE